MEQKEKKEIIYRINNSKISDIELHYGKENDDAKLITKIEKIGYHRFINKTEPEKYRFYIQSIITDHLINISIPVVDTTRRHIFFDYDYYTKVYKINRKLELINKKYIIGLNEIGLFRISELDIQYKDICLDINIKYNDYV